MAEGRGREGRIQTRKHAPCFSSDLEVEWSEAGPPRKAKRLQSGTAELVNDTLASTCELKSNAFRFTSRTVLPATHFMYFFFFVFSPLFTNSCRNAHSLLLPETTCTCAGPSTVVSDDRQTKSQVSVSRT